MAKKPPPHPNNVVLLAAVRARRRVDAYRQRIGAIIETNRRAIGRLYQTGALFSRDGAKIGRDLLLAHQHMLKVSTLLARLANVGDVPAPRSAKQVDAMFDELDGLLERTNALTERTGHYLARLRTE
ncbi:MAG: hypothetical protein ACOZIN_21200 [Myxococcota bacterium]